MINGRIPPLYLELPSRSPIDPPTLTNKQELPLAALDWKDFERLCLRLARRQSDVQDCRTYGVQGDDQEGIDLFARLKLASERYRVYQCKKVASFGPAQIRAAVDEFLGGIWKVHANEFCICAMESFSQRKRIAEVLNQKRRLEAEGIAFVSWDADELNQQLKAQPDLVDDFFGRAWVAAFCGASVAAGLGSRLDRTEAARFRQEFGRLYLQIFRQHDPTFAFRDPIAPATDYPVLPDVVLHESFAGAFSEHTPRSHHTTLVSGPLDDADTDDSGMIDDSDVVVHQRTGVAGWLARHDKTFLVGGPGSGKSTLLRLVALDLLSDSPQIEEIVRRWGTHLPVWVPFSRWTTLLAESNASRVPLPEFLVDWLELFGAKEEVVALLRKAIQDDRLLLLIDGLDEFQTEQAGRNAKGLLEVFVGHRGVPAIVTCRPHALNALGQPGVQWQIGEIAPLSPMQQATLVQRGLAAEMLRTGAVDPVLCAKRTELLLHDVNKQRELADLATTPLLLGLLTQLWHREENLPENRFKAYDRLVDVLVVTHPARRVTAAQVNQVQQPAAHLRRALAALALAMQQGFGSGSIPRAEASRILESFLADEREGLAYSTAAAKSGAAEILTHATDRAGILVERSPQEVAFYHRALLEYLAAESLATRDQAFRLQIVREYARNPAWYEVIAALAAITASHEDVQRILDEILRLQQDRFDRVVTLPLLARLAFSAPSCPPQAARRLAHEVLAEIETGQHLPLRRQLLSHAMNGVRPGPTQTVVLEHLARWLPRRPSLRGHLYEAVGSWPPSAEQVASLQRGLYDERVSDARAAGRSLAKLALTDPTLRAALLATAKASDSPRLRAVLLAALAEEGLLTTSAQRSAIADNSARGELLFASIKARVLAKEQTDEDLEIALAFAQWGSPLDYDWREEIPQLLVRGWASAARLLDVCLASVRDIGDGHIMPTIARQVLIRGYANHPTASDFLAAELRAGTPPYSHEIFPLFAEFARECPSIVEAMDAWHLAHGDEVVEAYYATLTTRSKVAKHACLGSLNRHFLHWPAAALLECWGMQDADVSKALTSLALGDAGRANDVAHLMPQILADQATCRERLLDLLRDTPRRPDFIVRGLARLREAGNTSQPEPVVVTQILKAIESHSAAEAFGVGGLLLINWPEDPRVQEYARAELERSDDNIAAVAKSAATIETLRPLVLEGVGVLPAPLRLQMARDVALQREPSTAKNFARYHLEHDPSVRVQCAVVQSSGVTTPKPEFIARLLKEMSQTGAHMDATRAAAFCALLELGQIAAFRDASGAGTEPLQLRMRDFLGYNAPFWEEIARHWQSLDNAFGDQLCFRLTGSPLPDKDFWESLAPVAQQFTGARTALLAAIEEGNLTSLGPNTLKFLARERPASVVLRDACMRHMENGVRGTLWGERYTEQGLLAARLLGRTFRDDEPTLALIAPDQAVTTSPPTLTLVALCEGWSRSAKLDAIFQYLRENETKPTMLAHGVIVATKSPPQRVLHILRNYPDYVSAFSNSEVNTVSELMIRRIREDELVYSEANAALESADRWSGACLLRLMSEARGWTPHLRDLAQQSARRELEESTTPSLVRDPLSGRSVPVSNLLLDLVLPV